MLPDLSFSSNIVHTFHCVQTNPKMLILACKIKQVGGKEARTNWSNMGIFYRWHESRIRDWMNWSVTTPGPFWSDTTIVEPSILLNFQARLQKGLFSEMCLICLLVHSFRKHTLNPYSIWGPSTLCVSEIFWQTSTMEIGATTKREMF